MLCEKCVDVGIVGVDTERRADAVIGGTRHKAAGGYNTAAGHSKDINGLRLSQFGGLNGERCTPLFSPCDTVTKQ